MVMAPVGFAVTPESYNRQFELEFRDGGPRGRQYMTYEGLEKVRRKVRKWMNDNAMYFAL